MQTVAIIGAGAIGYRHYQSVLNCKDKLAIYVVDPNLDVLCTAEEYFNSLPSANGKSAFFVSDVSALPQQIDLAIVATTSKIRAQIILSLAVKTVRYFLLEKVLFTDLADYKTISDFLMERDIAAWVNCHLRTREGHKKVAESFQKDPLIGACIIGGDWGLGCNAIHNIDYLSYLCGDAPLTSVDCTLLDNTLSESKRGGYIEFTGTLSGIIDGRVPFSFISNAGSQTPPKVYLTGARHSCVLIPHKGIAYIIDDEAKTASQIPLPMLYQSQMTNSVVDAILETGSCDLPTYEMSAKLHLPLLKALLVKQNKITGEESQSCNIT